RSLEESARDVGAGPLRVFMRVTFPLAAPGIFVAMILSFLVAFDEAQGTFLVGIPNYITMPTEMYTLVLNYPEQAAAVFSILLGPSGCGKTTTLRMIGGFLQLDAGAILIDGTDVSGLPPERRPTAMVFQNYALWPHMTVFKNVAFGLKLRKLPKREIEERVEA